MGCNVPRCPSSVTDVTAFPQGEAFLHIKSSHPLSCDVPINVIHLMRKGMQRPTLRRLFIVRFIGFTKGATVAEKGVAAATVVFFWG